VTRYPDISWLASCSLIAADVLLCGVLIVVALLTAPLWILGAVGAWSWELIARRM